MATRNTTPRRVPGDPLGGVLRNTARLAARPRRRTAATVDETPVAEVRHPSSPTVTPVAGYVTTGVTGVALWHLPDSSGEWCVTAVATADAPVFVTVSQPAGDAVTVSAWSPQGERVPNVLVAVTAVPGPAPAPAELD